MTPAALRKASNKPLDRRYPRDDGILFPCPLEQVGLWTITFYFISGTQRAPRQAVEGLQRGRGPPAIRAAGLLTPGPVRILSSDKQNIGPSSCGRHGFAPKPAISWDRQCGECIAFALAVLGYFGRQRYMANR